MPGKYLTRFLVAYNAIDVADSSSSYIPVSAFDWYMLVLIEWANM